MAAASIVVAAVTLAGQLIKMGVDKKAVDTMVQDQYAMTEEQKKIYNQQLADVTDMWQPQADMGTTALSELNGFSYDSLNDRPEYSYDKTVDDFFDPYAEFARKTALQDLEQSASTGGGVGSGGTFDALMDRSEQYAGRQYNTAYDHMTSDDATKYGRYVDKFNTDKLLLDLQLKEIMNKVNLGNTAKSNITSAITGNANANAGIVATQGNLDAITTQNAGETVSGIVSAVGQGVGTVLGEIDSKDTTPTSTVTPSDLQASPAMFGLNNTIFDPSSGSVVPTFAEGNLDMTSSSNPSAITPTSGANVNTSYSPNVNSGYVPNESFGGYNPSIDFSSLYGGG